MVLCFSGGVDSYVAYHYLEYPPTVYFPTGSVYESKEIAVVKQLVPNTELDFSFNLGKWETGDKAYIPYRNLLFAAAASRYDNEVVIAGIKGDNVSDKNEEIFTEFSEMLSKLEGRNIKVTSPFWNYTKDEIVDWYLTNGLPIENLLKTVSCYSKLSDNYCGYCPSCFRKWCAFTNNGILIPFRNLELAVTYYKTAKKGDYYDEERNKSIIKAVERDFPSVVP